MTKAFVLLSIFLLLATLTACSTTNPYNNGTFVETSIDLSNPDDLQPFTSDSDYTSFFSSYSSSNYYGGPGDVMLMRDMAIPESASVGGAMAKGGEMETIATNNALEGGSDDYSQTNNQVQGVDEADILKTDGGYIYTITDNTVFILKAYPGEDAKVLSQFELEDVHPNELILKDDLLLVIGNADSYKFEDKLDFIPDSGLSFIFIYDISDKENPKLKKEFFLEGRYDTARLFNDAYIVTRIHPQVRDVYPLPVVYNDGAISTLKARDIFYLPNHYNNPEIVTVHKLNLDTFNLDSVAVTVDSLQTVYMSEDNVFIAGHESLNEYQLRQVILKELIKPNLSDVETTLITKIKNTDNDVLTQYEKQQKIDNIYFKRLSKMDNDEKEDLQKTADELLIKKLEKIEYMDYVILHKINLNSLKVTASNKIPGNVVNQFSLDEYEGNLRIATTIPRRWSNYIDTQKESTNNIYVLDKNLDVEGSLEGLADNERIYSTRFVKDRLYMITFRQVDPFFVIDLSNPSKPTNLGELKIPGFSNYLHPYDENHLIGIGKDATVAGRTTGLKISLFDVTDVENPKEVAKYVTDATYAQSTALYEHKAFLFSKEKNLLVIPTYSYEWKNNHQSGYAGAFVFNITENEINLRGLIDHTQDSGNFWNSQVERSLYIGDLLYTKSKNLLRINALDDLSSVKNISLKPGNNGDIPIY